MQPDQRSQLQDEVRIGQRASAAYNEFIEPFIKRMNEELYRTFNTISPMDKDALSDIRRLSMVVDQFDISIRNYITTGNFASIQLKEKPNE